jgi:hypothetical protein
MPSLPNTWQSTQSFISGEEDLIHKVGALIHQTIYYLPRSQPCLTRPRSTPWSKGLGRDPSTDCYRYTQAGPLINLKIEPSPLFCTLHFVLSKMMMGTSSVRYGQVGTAVRFCSLNYTRTDCLRSNTIIATGGWSAFKMVCTPPRASKPRDFLCKGERETGLHKQVSSARVPALIAHISLEFLESKGKHLNKQTIKIGLSEDKLILS